MENPPQSYMESQCYMPFDTTLNPARRADTQFICPRGIKGLFELGVDYMLTWFMCDR